MKAKKPSAAALQKVQEGARARIRLSYDAMSKRYGTWAENEEQFKAYIPTREEDELRKDKRKAGIPQYTTIEVPYSYAVAMTAHTYFTSVFLSRNPVLQVSGRHGEGENKTQAMEALLDYQLQAGENLVPLFLWLFDPIKYSVGWLCHYWDQERINVRRRVLQPRSFMGMPIPGTEQTVDLVEEIIGYEGHRFFNVRPQDAFPDPRVSMWNFQKGEFWGRYVELSWMDLYAGEEDGKYFDVRELERDAASGNASDRDVGSSAVTDLPDADDDRWISVSEKDGVPKFVKAYELYVRIVPRQWGLAASTKPELWVFTVRASDYKVFGCEPMGLYHNKFPVDVLEQEPEAYSLFSRSMMETMKPLNDAMTWMINSHMYNVRAVLNNQFVVDPSMVVMKDFENPAPGKLLRLKPAAYGRDARQAIVQLPVNDVTGSHVPNMQLMADMLQRVTGVSDNVMGVVNSGGRKTATEVRQSTTLGINRLKTVCEFWSAMGWSPMTQKLIQGSQQFYDAERQFRIVGDLASFSPGFATVTPDSIAGFFDFVPIDGSLPVDRFAQANLWQMMMGQMSKVPQVAQTYDLGRIFGWVASLAGLKNIQQFRIQITPNGMLGQQAAAGNVVPLDIAARDLGRPPNQMQVPGMGATG